MSSDAIPDQHRRLADALEAAEAEGAEVDAVESFTVDGELVATIDVGVGVGEQTERPDQSTADDVVDADASAVDPGDEPAPSTPSESDIAPDDLEDDQDDFDPDEAVDRLEEEEDRDVEVYSIGTESGLRDGMEEVEAEEDTDEEPEPEPEEADDQPRPDDLESEEDPEPPADSLAAEVLATLRDEGELAGPEIKTITGAGTDMYTALGDLQDDDLVEKRKDPDDGRRTLYRPAGWLVDDGDDQDEEPEWNGRDPEEIVADSSLPARVVLDDILDAVPTADTVIDLAEELDVNVDTLEPVCWPLTLKQADSLAIVSDVDERVETIREVVGA